MIESQLVPHEYTRVANGIVWLVDIVQTEKRMFLSYSSYSSYSSYPVVMRRRLFQGK